MTNDGIVIVGAGGHAKVVLATAVECGLKVSSIIDDDPAKWGKSLWGVKIGGPISSFNNRPTLAVMAIGDNKTRKKIAEMLSIFDWVTLVHPTAYVHSSAVVGKGTVIFAGSIIQPDAKIGDHCIINTGVTVDHDCRIGNFAHLAPGTHLAGGASVGEGAFLGIGSKVIMGKTIGDWAIVGAGSVVVGDIPPGAVATGVPARVTK